MHEENTGKQVRVFGELVRSNNSVPVVSADGVYDYNQTDEHGNKKTQEQLNDEFKTAIDNGVTISTTENHTSVKLVEGTEFRVEAGTGVKVGKWGEVANSIQINADTDVLATKTDLTAKYEKPSGGIPKVDLASDVQASLNKANTALQNHQDISGKADKTDTYTKDQTYSKNEVDDAIAAIDVSWQLTDYALKTEVTNAVNAESTRAQGVEATKANTVDVNSALGNKQDTIQDLNTIRNGAARGATAQQPATTLAGYGITDGYTKTEGQALETQVTNAIDSVQDTVNSLNGNDVVVVADHSDVTNPDGQKIYREQGSNSYTDWMYQDSSWKEIATYTMPGFDNAPTKNSEKLVKSGAVFKAIQDDAVFDVSAHNLDLNQNPTPYESLALALAVIPTANRKAGMSIKFIDSEKNEYVQYRFLGATTDGFINTDNWAIAEEGVYVENPEFIYVKTDAEGKILWAIKNNGDIYYGAGVPQQVVDYTNERISELSLDEKVDKEEDKSLIDADYASTKSTIDNPKFLDVTLDAEDKILEGIQVDGTKVIGGDVNVGGSAKILGNMEVSGVSYRVIENTEYIAAWVDAEDKVIFGFKTDGKTCVGDADFLDDIESIKAFLANFNDKAIDWDALTSITATENSELIEAKTDSEGKLLAGRTPNGAAFENVGFSTPKISIKGHTIENIEDTEERSEITTDAEGKIISYRDSDGMKHEEVGVNSAVVNTNNLNLTAEGMTEFQQALKDAGFRPGENGGWSDYITNDGDSPLEIAMPRCAHLNLLTDFNLVNLKKAYYNGSIKGVNYDIPIEVEFFDMQGNYFKKKAFISGQGRSTMNRDKKNIAIDFFDSDWDDDAFAIRFGDWVPQDSFHLKAYANEAFNANGTWAYKIYDAMSKSWGIEYDYLYKRALLDMSQNTSVKAYGTEPSDNEKFEDTGAKCFPDGFPVIVYQNGEFWGVFSWQLKKHRDNYKMKKSEVKHIHLDGIIDRNVWDTNGAPEWWTLEIRNPKDVVYSSAHLDSVTNKYTYKYDGDLSQENIAGNQQWSDIHEYPINYVVEYDGKRYISLQNGNVGNNPTTASAYWSVDSETPYDLWVSGTSYPQNKVIEHNGHRFINSVAGNTEEPIIDSERGINTDKAPDFKNKTGCGWINCTNTIKVKNYIINMSRIMTKIKEKEDAYLADTTAENLQELKDTFETYFDVDNLVDYLIINDIINNADAFASNWQWLTYDGVKWWCGLYDCNISFGYGGGQYTTANFRAPLTGHAGGSSNYMMRYIKVYYKDELEARYSFLRRNNVVTAEKIVYDIIIDWTNAVGYVNYAKEREKWPGEVSVDNIYRLKKWVYETIANLDILYRYSNI